MRLPLFPLGAVLYPLELMPLHIFEARYRTMAARCLDDCIPFGILWMDEGKMASIGCTARIQRVLQRYSDGRLDILAEGEKRFKVAQLYDNRAYLTGDVHYLDESVPVPAQHSVKRVIAQHMRLLELAGRKISPSAYRHTSTVSFIIGRSAGLSLKQKQAVLEIPSEALRIRYLIEHFAALISKIETTRALRKKIQSNGHLERGDL